jgi:hypothetical protein
MTAGRMRSEPKINFKATELVNKLSLVRRINDDYISKYYYKVVIVTHIRYVSLEAETECRNVICSILSVTQRKYPATDYRPVLLT